MRLNEEYRIRPGSALYYSLLYTPERRRAGAETLHAFAREVTGVPRKCSDPGVARLKLQWWRAELARALAGQPRHPLGSALHAVHTSLGLDIAQFGEFIDGVETALQWVTPPSPEALTEYHQDVAGTLWRAWAALNGGGSGCFDSAAALGSYVERAATLRNLRTDLAAGFYKLDHAQLAAYGVSHEQLAALESTTFSP